MGIFNNKKKIKTEWTDKTAPQKKQIQLEISTELLLKSGADTYSTFSDRRIGKNEIKKALLCTTDSSKEEIKEEIAQKLEDLYNELCQSIDNNETDFSQEYWYNKEFEKSNELIAV